MKLIEGTDIHVPNSDTHFTGRTKAGRPVVEGYQRQQLDEALARVKDFSVAVDIGAHVGLMTRALAERFDRVHSFEPSAETFECLLANTKHLPNVTIYNVALGEKECLVDIEPVKTNSGDVQLLPNQAGVTPMHKLDRYNLPACGLMKLDVQGYERLVLEGARETILAHAPVILYEEEPEGKLRRQFDRVGSCGKFLGRMGASEVARIGNDVVMEFGPDGAEPFSKYEENGDYHWKQYLRGKTTAMVDQVVEYVASRHPGGRILDIGCGDGLYAAKLIQKLDGYAGASVIGIDTSAEGVRLAQLHGVNARCLSLFRLPLGERYGSVLLLDVFEHLPLTQVVMTVLERITSDVFLLNPDPNGSNWHVHEWTTKDLTATFKVNGWTALDTTPIPEYAKTMFHFRKESP